MPFCLLNAPGTFQRLMDYLFKDHLCKRVLISLDDVLAYHLTEDKHFKHIEVIFKLLRSRNLKLKHKISRPLQQQVVYLRHVIDKNGARRNPQKVVRERPEPNTVKEVRFLVGFRNYYRRFIKDYAHVARPLHELRNKISIRVDSLLSNGIQLTTSRYDCPFIIDTEASNVNLGALLSNFIDGVEYPIVFLSRSLSNTENMYCTTKEEALAVGQALKWVNHYIWVLSFVIRTDQGSLKRLCRQNADGMTFRVVQNLQEFNNEVVHRT